MHPHTNLLAMLVAAAALGLLAWLVFDGYRNADPTAPVGELRGSLGEHEAN